MSRQAAMPSSANSATTSTCAWLAVCVLVACGKTDEPNATAASSAAAPAHDKIAPGVPHGGTLAQIAVTEQGDAALSSDNLGGVRLWPSLDGKRPPVPVSAQAPSQLAITHAGQDLLVAIVDQAGTVQLFRLGLDGSVLARTQLDNDAPAEQIVAVGSSVLVRRLDHSIEKFDANGMSRGKLVAQPGERIMTIAARRGSAIALLETAPSGDEIEPKGASTLRWIVTTGDLRWGTSVVLPEAVATTVLALSPDHRKVAAMNLRTSNLEVFSIDPLPKRASGDATIALTSDSAVGFFDDDRAVVVHRQIQWWTANQDPWAATRSTLPAPAVIGSDDAGAIGDGLLVTSHGPSLALSDAHDTKYLGWADLASGTPMVLGSSFATTLSSTRISWLDERLARVHDFEIKQTFNGATGYVIPVGDHHAAVESQTNAGGPEAKTAVDIIDIDHPDKPTPVGTFSAIDLFQYSPELSVLAIGGGGIVHRFRLDPVTRAPTAMAPLQSIGALSQIWMTDPARADGVVAIGVGWEGGSQRLQTFRAIHADLQPIKATSSPVEGTVLFVDPTGTVDVRAPSGAVVAMRGKKQVAEIKFDSSATVVPRDDTKRFAVIKGSSLTLADDTGRALWQQTLWGFQTAAFASHGKTLLVRASNGLVLFDVETGTRVAVACAWGFGLHAQPTSDVTFGQPPLCEDGS